MSGSWRVDLSLRTPREGSDLFFEESFVPEEFEVVFLDGFFDAELIEECEAGLFSVFEVLFVAHDFYFDECA